MNKLLKIAIVILAGAFIYAVHFALGPTLLHLLARFYSEGTLPTDMSWRAGVTVSMAIIDFLAFGLVGFWIGRMWPSAGWTWGLWLAVFPAVAEILIFFTGVLYPLTMLAGFAAILAGGIAGSHIGASSRSRVAVT